MSPPSHAASASPNLADRLRSGVNRVGARTLVHLVLLLVILTGAIVHNLQMSHWYIEDAAIDFAYAKHLVDGHGFVPTPGGEVVEGYSNPTWLAVLVVSHALGFDPFPTVHWIGLGFSLLALLGTYFAAREMAGRDSELPILATAFLAASSQFAIWGTAGLENPLWNFLMAVGLWRMAVELRETETDRFRYPWSSVAWLLLSLTRPEGILYAALAGFFHLCWTVAHKRTVVPTVLWLATFFVPWTAYQVWHWQTFAWPFPNTFYAKVDRKDQMPFAWNRRSWNWTRSFFLDTGQGFFLPVWLLGVLGHERWRVVVATVAFAVLGLLIELSDDQRWLLPVVVGVLWMAFWFGLRRMEAHPPRWMLGAGTVAALALVGASELLRWQGVAPQAFAVPELLEAAPSYVLTACAVLFALVGVGARGWTSRVPAWLFCCAAIGFAVYSQGDWMKGYRWFAMATVPGSLLFAWGTWSFAKVVEQMFEVPRASELGRLTPVGLGLSALLVGLQLPGNIQQTRQVMAAPDPPPRGIVPRIEYVRKIAARLHYEEPIADADVDMGAHLYWTNFKMLDIAGLVDVPFAHQRFEKPFVREYLFEEEKPVYIHIHGGWAGNSKIPTHPEFRRDYVEIPGFPAGKSFHIGNYIRRDAMVTEVFPRPADRIAMEDGLVLYAPWVPAEAATDRRFYVEVGLADTRPTVQRKKEADDFRLVLFAASADQVVKSWELPPGYDWLWPREWKDDEAFLGKFDLTLKGVPPGTYDLGYVLTREDGTVVRPLEGEAAPLPAGVLVGGRGEVPARMATGELVFPGALRVLDVDARAQLAKDQIARVQSESEAGRCEEAERAWSMARWHRAGEKDFADHNRPRVSEALSTCWATSADAHADDRPEQVRRLRRAHRWDWTTEAYTSRALPLAAALEQEGKALLDSQAYDEAYRLLSDAVALDGTRTFSRRWAEEARAFRLGIDPASLEKRDAEEKARKAEADARRTSASARQRRGARLPTDAEKAAGRPEDEPEQGDAQGPPAEEEE